MLYVVTLLLYLRYLCCNVFVVCKLICCSSPTAFGTKYRIGVSHNDFRLKSQLTLNYSEERIQRRALATFFEPISPSSSNSISF